MIAFDIFILNDHSMWIIDKLVDMLTHMCQSAWINDTKNSFSGKL